MPFASFSCFLHLFTFNQNADILPCPPYLVSQALTTLRLWHTEHSQNTEIILCTIIIKKIVYTYFINIYESHGVFCGIFSFGRKQ